VSAAPPSAVDDRLTVIVPCLDEAGTVTRTVELIDAAAAALPVRTELLLVDDGSSDGTGDVLASLCARLPRCRMRSNPRNRGLGWTVLDCYGQIQAGSWVTVIPGDNEIIFDSISSLLAIRHDYDVILGYLGNPVIRTLPRRAGSAVFSVLVRALYGFPYRYLNGLKLYRVEAFAGIDVVSGGHAFNAELLAKAVLRNPFLRVGEAPFLARGRSFGRSKAFRPRSVLRAARELLAGYRSVSAYRRQIVTAQAGFGSSASGGRRAPS
jgi:glycosyltransferase involved in cell wall biosynthesis